jgi:PAS domain S-box-containing protein
MSKMMFRKQSAAGAFAFFHDLIAGNQAKEQLQFQSTILRNVSESVIVTDLHGHIVYWNEGATSLFGYTAEEMLDKTPALLYPEVGKTQFLPDVENILAGEDYIGEWRGQRKDGALIWIEIKTTVLRTTRGEAIGFIGVARDVTERKQAAETRLQLAAIVESSDDAIIGKTLDGIITNWNMAAERMYGYTAKEAVGQPITLLFPPDRQDEFATIMQQITRGERVDHIETKRVRKDGTIIAVSVTISPIKDSDGTIIGASAIARDITRQKRLEAEVKQSRQQLEVVLHHIADGITVQDRSGAIIYANDAGAKLCGFASAQELLALDLEQLRTYYLERFELKDEFGQPLSYTALPATNALQGERYTQALVNYIDKHTGKSLWSVVKASPIFDAQGQVQFAITIFSDLTERMELEQRKDTFMSMASHELKTPVTSLKGFTQLLKRRVEKQDMQGSSDLLVRMETQIARLTKLIEDLLDVSKIQAGGLEYAEERIAIDALIQDSIETIQHINTTHSIRIHGTSHKYVIGDSDRLGQVFINLMTNAIKYSPQATRVDVSIAAAHDEVLVGVRDYGVGIPEEHLSKVFERFYRVHDAKEQTIPGLGMGLYIAHEIVKRHGGRIWVESTERKGATFYVALPTEPEDEVFAV